MLRSKDPIEAQVEGKQTKKNAFVFQLVNIMLAQQKRATMLDSANIRRIILSTMSHADWGIKCFSIGASPAASRPELRINRAIS